MSGDKSTSKTTDVVGEWKRRRLRFRFFGASVCLFGLGWRRRRRRRLIIDLNLQSTFWPAVCCSRPLGLAPAQHIPYPVCFTEFFFCSSFHSFPLLPTGTWLRKKKSKLGFLGYYLVLLGFTGFYRVWLAFDLISLGFIGFYWVLACFTLFLLGLSELYWVLLGFIRFSFHLVGFYRVLLSFSLFNLVFTGFYWV